MDANITRSPFQPASKTVYESDRDCWSMDLFDLGADCVSTTGKRYVFVFVLLHSRLIVEQTTATKDEALQALRLTASQIGYLPKRLRSDNAGEFESQEFVEFCDSQPIPIFREWSHSQSQQQNGISESVVH